MKGTRSLAKLAHIHVHSSVRPRPSVRGRPPKFCTKISEDGSARGAMPRPGRVTRPRIPASRGNRGTKSLPSHGLAVSIRQMGVENNMRGK